jgi:hypothetical protein
LRTALRGRRACLLRRRSCSRRTANSRAADVGAASNSAATCFHRALRTGRHFVRQSRAKSCFIRWRSAWKLMYRSDAASMRVWAERSVVTSNAMHHCIHRGNNFAGKSFHRLHVGFHQTFWYGCGFERKQHQLQSLHLKHRAQAARHVARPRLRDCQWHHHPGGKATQQVTLYIDNERVLLAHPRTWIAVDVELHLPNPQVVAPQAVFLESRVLFFEPSFVGLIEHLLLLLQRLALAA